MGIKQGHKLISKNDRQFLKRLGLRIREIRESKQMRLEDTISEEGIKNYQHFLEIEQGKKNLTTVTLFKVAKTLGVKPSKLIEGLEF